MQCITMLNPLCMQDISHRDEELQNLTKKLEQTQDAHDDTINKLREQISNELQVRHVLIVSVLVWLHLTTCRVCWFHGARADDRLSCCSSWGHSQWPYVETSLLLKSVMEGFHNPASICARLVNSWYHMKIMGMWCNDWIASQWCHRVLASPHNPIWTLTLYLIGSTHPSVFSPTIWFWIENSHIRLEFDKQFSWHLYTQ